MQSSDVILQSSTLAVSGVHGRHLETAARLHLNLNMFTIGELATVAKVIMKASPSNSDFKSTPHAGTDADTGSVLDSGSACFTNCSGHGLCHEGECWCEVQFRGASCQATNLLYYTVFSCLFFLLSLISLVQLAVCVQAEYHKRHKPSLRDVFTVTNQKLVYLFVSIATASRGFYFAIQLSHPVISFNLQTVYYPLILTIFSLIVCLWAESFHINTQPPQNPTRPAPPPPSLPAPRSNVKFFATQLSSSSQGAPCGPPSATPNASFLTKSLGAFITFNVLMYILLFLQLLATNTWVKDIAGKKYWMRISKACFASLTLLVVVFFLIYGVEMFFKVRGAFVDANRRLNTYVACSSRLSLIAQAACLLFLALFLFSDVAFIHFEKKITDLGISYFDTACRAVDLCVAIWFPLVLWKSAKPDDLWLLNPRVLFQKLPSASSHPDIVEVLSSMDSNCAFPSSDTPSDWVADGVATNCSSPSPSIAANEEALQECFICYDSERDDAGPLIKPCKCKGDTAVVHHDCLRRWLLQSIPGITDDDVAPDTEAVLVSSTSATPTFSASGRHRRRRRRSKLFPATAVNQTVTASSSTQCYHLFASMSPPNQSNARIDGDDDDEEEEEEEEDSGVGGVATCDVTLQKRHSSAFKLTSGGLGLLLGGVEARNQLRCKVCNQPYRLQTSFMIQCQAQNWKLWLRWILGLGAMTALPFAASAVFQITTDPAPRVLALAILFLFEYALWRLAGFNLVTLYNYAKLASFRIEGKPVTPHANNNNNSASSNHQNHHQQQQQQQQLCGEEEKEGKCSSGSVEYRSGSSGPSVAPHTSQVSEVNEVRHAQTSHVEVQSHSLFIKHTQPETA